MTKSYLNIPIDKDKLNKLKKEAKEHATTLHDYIHYLLFGDEIEKFKWLSAYPKPESVSDAVWNQVLIKKARKGQLLTDRTFNRIVKVAKSKGMTLEEYLVEWLEET